MAVFKIEAQEGTEILAAGHEGLFSIRTRNGGHSTHAVMSYDETERLRDFLNEYLVKYWPQEEDTE